MEADGSVQGLVATTSDSHDGEPPAVRRRLDLEGSFISMDRNRTCQSASDQRISERTPLKSSEKENDEDSGGDESLPEVTPTSQQGCDTSPSVLDASRGGLCRIVSHGDLVVTVVEQVVKMSHGDIAVQEVDSLNSNGLNTASTRNRPSEFISKEGELSSSSYISAREVVTPQRLQQNTNAVTCVTHQLKNHNVIRNRGGNKHLGDSKGLSETDRSCTICSSGGSSSGFNGDIDEAEYTGSLASSADLLEINENATKAIEMEKLKEEDSINVIGSCLDKVSSKICQLQEIAAKELRNDCASDNEGVIYGRVGDLNIDKGSASSVSEHCSTSSGVPSIHHRPENGGNSTLKGSASDGKNDISSERGDSCKQRFLAVKNYVLSVNSNVKWEVVEYDVASAASREMRASSSGDDRVSSKAQSEVYEDRSSYRSQVVGEGTADSVKEDYAKQLRITCKSGHKIRKIVSQQCEMISRICTVAEQLVRKMYVTRLAILNCVKGTANVASTALEAKRVVRLCLQEATARGCITVLEVAKAAVTCSRFSKEAVTFDEGAVQLHKEAVDAVREAEALLDDIQLDQWEADFLSSQASAFGDDLVKVIQQTSSISLEELKDEKSYFESSRAELSFDLKKVKEQSTVVEHLTYRCDRLLSDTLQVLPSATISSAKAIDAALKGIQTLKSES